ncbi:Molybdopterin-guanine dinucleotide biosynthesis adapter protein [Sporotomaculum syntrophicum]|uniref:Molybdopterin-guanine dinucleotide biosynthesis adapter protein n=1 Tax=Sporotomaculum syntrophicum TaxID=182264 RepID=A0A9D3AZE3_9FIRM|nr:molybdopterin-guanine dinucleotide biosynthesis protein B [Sporotomaculum syntrophicum]KAF1085799.1 Molybdopterin-guanine dinucleotide biosynthesis adapter protein [Sporotomaculum syntrophicum]
MILQNPGCAPVIGLTGFSNTGKTTFLVKLIAELKKRGYQVGVVKHTHHHVEFDQLGKDTWRHAQAGADVVALATPDGVSMVRKYESDPGPEAVISMISGVDIILVEGYKRGNWPKIEVYRHDVSERPDIPGDELLAVVSDVPLDSRAPFFEPDDVAGVAELIEKFALRTS